MRDDWKGRARILEWIEAAKNCSRGVVSSGLTPGDLIVYEIRDGTKYSRAITLEETLDVSRVNYNLDIIDRELTYELSKSSNKGG